MSSDTAHLPPSLARSYSVGHGCLMLSFANLQLQNLLQHGVGQEKLAHISPSSRIHIVTCIPTCYTSYPVYVKHTVNHVCIALKCVINIIMNSILVYPAHIGLTGVAGPQGPEGPAGPRGNPGPPGMT